MHIGVHQLKGDDTVCCWRHVLAEHVRFALEGRHEAPRWTKKCENCRHARESESAVASASSSSSSSSHSTCINSRCHSMGEGTGLQRERLQHDRFFFASRFRRTTQLTSTSRHPVRDAVLPRLAVDARLPRCDVTRFYRRAGKGSTTLICPPMGEGSEEGNLATSSILLRNANIGQSANDVDGFVLRSILEIESAYGATVYIRNSTVAAQASVQVSSRFSRAPKKEVLSLMTRDVFFP